MVAIDRVSQEAAEGGYMNIEPLGTIGGVGMVTLLAVQVGLKIGVDLAGIVYVADETGGDLGGEGLGKLYAQVLHTFGMGFQSLPLRAILVVW